MLSNLGLLAGLVLLMWLALRGVNIIFASLLSAALVAFSNGLPLAQSLTQDYAAGPLGAFTFAGKYFLLFAAGALFGRVMSESGAANSIANTMTRALGEQRVLWVVVLTAAILTYGGVVVFVVIFTLYPLGLRLVKAANIPKRLLCAAIALGAGTFTMTALPGTPSIHNVVAATSLGTDLYAGAGLGFIAAAIMFAGGMWFLETQRLKALANGEGFEPAAHEQVQEECEQSYIKAYRAFLPIIFVLSIIFLPRVLGGIYESSDIPEWLAFANSQSVVWPCMALLGGALLTLVLIPGRINAPLITFGRGVDDAVMPLLNTAAVIGFGSVVTKTEGFAHFTAALTDTTLPPLLSAFTSVSVVSGITGSASGGLQIFMSTMANNFLEKGIEPEVLHRIVTVASGGIDSLPHSGAVVAMFTIMGMTHKQAYKDVAIVTVVIPVLAALALVLLASITG